MARARMGGSEIEQREKATIRVFVPQHRYKHFFKDHNAVESTEGVARRKLDVRFIRPLLARLFNNPSFQEELTPDEVNSLYELLFAPGFETFWMSVVFFPWDRMQIGFDVLHTRTSGMYLVHEEQKVQKN